MTPLTLSRKSLPDYFPHQQDVAELQAQITEVGVRVDIDAPKGQDLTQIMDEMRAKYEKITLKNQEDLKAWHETQVISQCLDVSSGSCVCFYMYYKYFICVSRSQRCRSK